MNKNIIIIIWLGIILSCNKHKCPDGYECQDDKCVCPEGSFETYGICRQLEANEFYGVTDKHCPCQDSIILRVTLWNDDKFNFDIQRGTSWGRGIVPREIRNDTIFPFGGGNNSIIGFHCSNSSFDPYITLGGFATISETKDSLIFYVPITPLTSNWENPDTCIVVFHK
jgi:hypothetical protein